MRLIDAFTSLAASMFLAPSPEANHKITLHNNCGHPVNLRLSNWPNHPPYNGPPIGSVAAKSSKSITVPNGWDGRICEATGGCGGDGNCYGKCSMTEFNMDSNGKNYYDISNIQAFTVAQGINAGGNCQTVTCNSANCPCDQAYGIGNMGGTCPGSNKPDRPVRACEAPDFTIVYCP
ncbi:hypothetical protein RSOLAG22IIIB_12327 [Rhizoctonia solani]|uniref:Osmotin, thaumatin-like protein n=1 Tax=Rhizoctonia solani TaxID=456999 RepID=A0A0K6GD08_9AGAM|nr:hypothetical protein RSOLAG22IIIB_12327 [Rhizoctonia solani]